MKLQGPVLVGTDFTAASDEALRQGYDLANDLGTSLIVCHVVPDLDTVDVLFPQLAARNAEHRQMLTDKAMAAVERQVAATLGDTRRTSEPSLIRERLTPACWLKRTLRVPVSSF